MPKFYVESGEMQMVIQAERSHDAAVCAFHTFCERRTESLISAGRDDDRRSADDELQDTIRVDERGFGRDDAEVFDTLDVLAAWQGCAFPWED